MAMRPVHRRYLWQFLPAMGGYALLIALYGVLVPQTASPFWRAVLALLPMLPVLLAMRAIARVVREQDELERLIDLQAMAIASVLTSCGYLSFGLLLGAGVLGRMPANLVALLVFPSFFTVFGVAKAVVVLGWRRR